MIMLIIGDNVYLNGFYVFLLITYIVEILVSQRYVDETGSRLESSFGKFRILIFNFYLK